MTRTAMEQPTRPTSEGGAVVGETMLGFDGNFKSAFGQVFAVEKWKRTFVARNSHFQPAGRLIH